MTGSLPAAGSPAAGSTPASASPGSASLTEADPGLFAIMGGVGSGLAFEYDAATTATVAADPGLSRDAVGLAIGLYTVAGQQPVTDFAIVSVVHLRDPSVDDEWYRSYRDSYDQSACAQAGGVARHAEAVFGGHPAFITGCQGGALIYHLRVRSGSIVVSITAVGPARLGDRLAADVDQP